MDGEENLIEDKLILKIARALPSVAGVLSPAASARTALALGIGDDAAVLASARRGQWVLTTDAFLEGIHFLGNLHPADSIGYKALVRAASDLAAMGARPRAFFLTLSIPARRTGVWLEGLLRGMGRAARELGLVLAGGDTSRFGSVAIAITVLGEVPSGRAVTRSGARRGDVIYVSGRLGRAQLGLELLRRSARGSLAKSRRSAARLLRPHLYPHLYPKIRLELGAWLAERGIASAMMDLSDGLSTDLTRLCAASGVSARIWADRIPPVEIPAGRVGGLKTTGLEALAMALHGGEDYKLIFTVPPRRLKQLRRAPGFSELTAIGQIERSARGIRTGGILLVDSRGRAKPLRPGGWDSFRRS